MRGQWLGTYTGSTDGTIMINIDELEDHFEAVAYLRPHIIHIPTSIAFIKTSNKDDNQTVIASIFPIDPRTGFIGDWSQIKDLYPPEVEHSSQAEVTLVKSQNFLTINATSDIGVSFACKLKSPSSNHRSKVKGKKMSWANFKKHVSTVSKSKYLFRGQKEAWKLCTSFHRRGRYRISEFIGKDVKQLHQKLSAITSHFFELNIPEQKSL